MAPLPAPGWKNRRSVDAERGGMPWQGLMPWQGRSQCHSPPWLSGGARSGDHRVSLAPHEWSIHGGERACEGLRVTRRNKNIETLVLLEGYRCPYLFLIAGMQQKFPIRPFPLFPEKLSQGMSCHGPVQTQAGLERDVWEYEGEGDKINRDLQ